MTPEQKARAVAERIVNEHLDFCLAHGRTDFLDDLRARFEQALLAFGRERLREILTDTEEIIVRQRDLGQSSGSAELVRNKIIRRLAAPDHPATSEEETRHG